MNFPVGDQEENITEEEEMGSALSVLLCTGWEILLCPVAVMILGGAIFGLQILLSNPASYFTVNVLQAFLHYEHISTSQILSYGGTYLFFFLTIWVVIQAALAFFQHGILGTADSLSRIGATTVMAAISTVAISLIMLVSLVLVRAGLFRLLDGNAGITKMVLLSTSGVFCTVVGGGLLMVSLLAVSRLAFWEDETAPWVEGVALLWRSMTDLLSMPRIKLAMVASLLTLLNMPVLFGVMYFTVRHLQCGRPGMSMVYLACKSLLIAFSILWVAEGLRRISDDPPTLAD